MFEATQTANARSAAVQADRQQGVHNDSVQNDRGRAARRSRHQTAMLYADANDRAKMKESILQGLLKRTISARARLQTRYSSIVQTFAGGDIG